MDPFMYWFGVIANAITVIAGIIAIAGVVWTIRGRAKLEVRSQSSSGISPYLTVALTSAGSTPVKDLELVGSTLTPDEYSMMGDTIVRRAELNRGDSLLVYAYSPAQLQFGDAPRENEHRWELKPDEGFYVNAQWRSPFLPWRRASRTFAWTTTRRFSGQEAVTLKGRSELAFLRRTRDPALNPLLPGYSPPLRATSILATDKTFDDLLNAAGKRVTVVVGFGPTWQGDHWQDVRRVLDAFAANHPRAVRTLVVHTDESPRLAARFNTDVVPTFKAFRAGKLLAEHDGLGSYQDLVSAFARYL